MRKLMILWFALVPVVPPARRSYARRRPSGTATVRSGAPKGRASAWRASPRGKATERADRTSHARMRRHRRHVMLWSRSSASLPARAATATWSSAGRQFHAFPEEAPAAPEPPHGARAEERRVGKGGVSQRKSRG